MKRTLSPEAEALMVLIKSGEHGCLCRFLGMLGETSSWQPLNVWTVVTFSTFCYVKFLLQILSK